MHIFKVSVKSITRTLVNIENEAGRRYNFIRHIVTLQESRELWPIALAHEKRKP